MRYVIKLLVNNRVVKNGKFWPWHTASPFTLRQTVKNGKRRHPLPKHLLKTVRQTLCGGLVVRASALRVRDPRFNSR